MATQIIPFELNLQGQSVPYLADWFGVWCMEDRALDALVLSVSNLDLVSHMSMVAEKASSQQMRNRTDSQGVAVISIDGVMQKHSSSMGGGNNSTVMARRAIRAAASDPNIGSILLNISSPGGASAGTQELFDDVVKANSIKPVLGFADDLCASAAYWAICGAQRVYANEAALVGSIGTYAVVQDFSNAADKAGIKVHVVKAGAFKGMGAAGTQITEEQLSELQKLVASRNEFFIKGVASGRKMSIAQATILADGRTHSAADAIKHNLIDAVASFEQAFEFARVEAANFLTPSTKKGTRMSESNTTIKEIKSACPGATSEFILSCMEKDITVAEASKLWSQELATENVSLVEANTALTEANAKLVADLAKANADVASLTSKLEESPKLPSGKIGVAPLAQTSTSENSQSPSEAYWAKVQELQTTGKSKREAMAYVNKHNPEIREAMVLEANTNSRR